MFSRYHRQERYRYTILTLWGLLWIISFLVWGVVFHPVYTWVANYFDIPQL